MPNNTSYVITNVNDMIAELFTSQGRGTYFKKKDKIVATNDLSQLNLEKLKHFIEASFDKTLKPEYFDELKTRNPIIFFTHSYSALAIVTRDYKNIAYLDKFCVAHQHQVNFFN